VYICISETKAGKQKVIRIAICDDHPAQVQVISTLMEKYWNERPGSDLELHNFDSGESLLEYMTDGCVFNLLLLDILMPGINGIDLAKKIRKHDDDAVIIFLTMSKDHALDAFGISALQYILKPIKERNLFPVLDKIIPTMHQRKNRFFLVSDQERDVKVSFSSIVCVELEDRRLRIYLDNGQILYSKYLRTTFSEAVAPLLQDRRFLRPHKSYVLNADKVVELRKTAFIMNHNIQVPVSRPKYAEVKNAYISYISDNHDEPGPGRGGRG